MRLKNYKVYINMKKPLSSLLADERFTKEKASVTIAESTFDDSHSKWWLLATMNNECAVDLSLETESDILDSESCSSEKTLSSAITRMLESVCA